MFFINDNGLVRLAFGKRMVANELKTISKIFSYSLALIRFPFLYYTVSHAG